MQKITPVLWFDDQAEEAAQHYVSVFNARREAVGGGSASKVVSISRYGEVGPGEPGTAMTVQFELDGQAFAALNEGRCSGSPRRSRWS